MPRTKTPAIEPLHSGWSHRLHTHIPGTRISSRCICPCWTRRLLLVEFDGERGRLSTRGLFYSWNLSHPPVRLMVVGIPVWVPRHPSRNHGSPLVPRKHCNHPCAAFGWLKSVTGSNAALAGRGCVRVSSVHMLWRVTCCWYQPSGDAPHCSLLPIARYPKRRGPIGATPTSHPPPGPTVTVLDIGFSFPL
jgi:hypothetical protein